MPPETRDQIGILVVDDDERIRTLLNQFLGQHGFKVWLADGGKAAIDLFRVQHKAIDIVLLDVQMPGSDGPATLVSLREIDPHLPCCYMTGDNTQRDLLDAAIVFDKPFDDLTGVARLLREAAHRR